VVALRLALARLPDSLDPSTRRKELEAFEVALSHGCVIVSTPVRQSLYELKLVNGNLYTSVLEDGASDRVLHRAVDVSGPTDEQEKSCDVGHDVSNVHLLVGPITGETIILVSLAPRGVHESETRADRSHMQQSKAAQTKNKIKGKPETRHGCDVFLGLAQNVKLGNLEIQGIACLGN
jgi:hypothetical protein